MKMTEFHKLLSQDSSRTANIFQSIARPGNADGIRKLNANWGEWSVAAKG